MWGFYVWKNYNFIIIYYFICLYKIYYQKIDINNIDYPKVYKVFEKSRVSMKNAYKELVK